jgi:hypothetical protein
LTIWDYVRFGLVLYRELADLNCDGVIGAFDIDPIREATGGSQEE